METTRRRFMGFAGAGVLAAAVPSLITAQVAAAIPTPEPLYTLSMHVKHVGSDWVHVTETFTKSVVMPLLDKRGGLGLDDALRLLEVGDGAYVDGVRVEAAWPDTPYHTAPTNYLRHSGHWGTAK